MFDWTFPYPSQRMPVFAANVVATSQPLAAQAGLRMMERGGNAIDASIATAAALTVVEPTSNGLGSDAFALIWHGGKLHALNASGKSPAALSPDHFAGKSSIPALGWGSVTVPGAISAWAALHERFGSLPFDELLAPAVKYAHDGYPVSPQTSNAWHRAQATYQEFQEWQATFCPTGRAPRPGDIYKSEDHGRTLESIALTSGRCFYEGELARAIASHAQQTGGLLTLNDLQAHEPLWVEPISLDYHGITVHELPPNGQGLAALLALGLARRFDLASLDPDAAESIHIKIEAMKLAFADAHRFIADPDAMDLTVDDLLDESYLDARAALIRRDRAQDFQHGSPKPGGTVYLATADAAGNMVSFIQSNYMGFGSGIVVPGTGIALQNRGANFTLEAGHPNQVAGGKRPYHTIIPGFATSVTHAGVKRTATHGSPSGAPGPSPHPTPLLAFGIMGGFMQPQGHMQFIARLADHNQNPQAALDAPRWRVEDGMRVSIEPGLASEVYGQLRDLGHDVTIADARTVAHGGGQAICRLSDGVYLGASDQRRDGQAVGF